MRLSLYITNSAAEIFVSFQGKFDDSSCEELYSRTFDSLLELHVEETRERESLVVVVQSNRSPIVGDDPGRAYYATFRKEAVS